MPDQPAIHRSEEPLGSSDRLRLARAALQATLAVAGVVDMDAGPMGLYVTRAGGERLQGIICAASEGGGYDISVRLIAGLVPLPALSESIAAAIHRAAALVDVPCRSVNVYVADIVDGTAR